MNSVFPKVIDEIKRKDSINELNRAIPDHCCGNEECKAECGKIVKIAKNLGVDPVPMVQDAVEKTLASKFGCRRKAEAFSNIGYPIPGCKFGYTYGSHPDATDAQIAAGKTGGKSHSITDTQIPDASEGVQVAEGKTAGEGSDSQANETPQDGNKTASFASGIQKRVEEAKEKIRQVVDDALKSAKDGVIPPEKLEKVEKVIKEEKTELENLLKVGGKILRDNKQDAEGLLEDGKEIISNIKRETASKYRDKMKEKGPSADAADSVSAGVEAAKQTYEEISNALKQMHYERNKRQGNLPKSPTEAVEQGYAEASRNENRYHGGDKGNKKYVNKETGQEVVFDKDGNTVTSPEEGGTYNYGKKQGGIGHLVRDVLPYWIFGNTPEDSTKTKDRIWGK